MTSPEYHFLPTDDPLKAVNILRAAAGLDPLDEATGETDSPQPSD
jgi:hypothetical protein